MCPVAWYMDFTDKGSRRSSHKPLLQFAPTLQRPISRRPTTYEPHGTTHGTVHGSTVPSFAQQACNGLFVWNRLPGRSLTEAGMYFG